MFTQCLSVRIQRDREARSESWVKRNATQLKDVTLSNANSLLKVYNIWKSNIIFEENLGAITVHLISVICPQYVKRNKVLYIIVLCYGKQ